MEWNKPDFYGMVGFLGSYPLIKEMISMGIKQDPK
jgi:hypothetical protein